MIHWPLYTNLVKCKDQQCAAALVSLLPQVVITVSQLQRQSWGLDEKHLCPLDWEAGYWLGWSGCSASHPSTSNCWNGPFFMTVALEGTCHPTWICALDSCAIHTMESENNWESSERLHRRELLAFEIAILTVGGICKGPWTISWLPETG